MRMFGFRIPFFHVLFLALMIASNIQESFACSCMARGTNPIPIYKAQPVVFVGTVTSIAEDTLEINRFGTVEKVRTGLTAYLRVDDPMKGVTGKEVTIFTGGGGGDCGYPFVVGEKYLVFARIVDDGIGESVIARTTIGVPPQSPKKIRGQALTTSICSLTQSAKRGQEDIDILRDYIAGRPRSRLSGSVLLVTEPFVGRPDIDFLGPLMGIQFKVRSAAKSYDVFTDESGKFLLRDVPAGRYTIEPQIAPYYENHWSWENSSFEINVAGPEDNYQFSLDVHFVGDIGGTVRDSDGKNVGEQVEVHLVPAEFIADPRGHHRSEYTKNGKFLFDGVPEGKYYLGIAIGEPATKTTPYPTVYYPNSPTASNAKIIEIKKGTRIKDIAFIVPPKLSFVHVSGQVVDSAGRPVKGANIRLLDSISPHGYIFGFDGFETDANGRFRAFGLAGASYLLHAYKDTNYLGGEGSQVTPVRITLSKPVRNMKLVLDKKGIFLNQLDQKTF